MEKQSIENDDEILKMIEKIQESEEDFKDLYKR
jgi:hypothetical protein